MKDIVQLFLFIGWIAGVVIAKGGWTLLAIFMPFYSWYLVIELLMQKSGLI
jgi:hypothetical protein